MEPPGGGPSRRGTGTIGAAMVLFLPLLFIVLVVVRTVHDRADLVLLLPTLVLAVAGIVVIRIAARDGRARDERARDRQARDRRARAKDRRARKGLARNGSLTVLSTRRNGHRRSP